MTSLRDGKLSQPQAQLLNAGLLALRRYQRKSRDDLSQAALPGARYALRMAQRSLVWTLSMALAATVGASACSSDSEEPAAPKSSVHVVNGPSCQEIMDTCHAADIEPGPAHDCHSVAHDDVEAECAAQKTGCLETCRAVLADAGID